MSPASAGASGSRPGRPASRCRAGADEGSSRCRSRWQARATARSNFLPAAGPLEPGPLDLSPHLTLRDGAGPKLIPARPDARILCLTRTTERALPERQRARCGGRPRPGRPHVPATRIPSASCMPASPTQSDPAPGPATASGTTRRGEPAPERVRWLKGWPAGRRRPHTNVAIGRGPPPRASRLLCGIGASDGL